MLYFRPLGHFIKVYLSKFIPKVVMTLIVYNRDNQIRFYKDFYKGLATLTSYLFYFLGIFFNQDLHQQSIPKNIRLTRFYYIYFYV